MRYDAICDSTEALQNSIARRCGMIGGLCWSFKEGVNHTGSEVDLNYKGQCWHRKGVCDLNKQDRQSL